MLLVSYVSQDLCDHVIGVSTLLISLFLGGGVQIMHNFSMEEREKHVFLLVRT